MAQALDTEQSWIEFRLSPTTSMRENLILQYAPLVKYVGGRMAVSLPGLLNSDDVLSYGTIGLIQAVDRFDPEQGVKFETYAIRRIRGSIIDAIRTLQTRSRDVSRRAREIERAYEELTNRLGRMPEEGEVAEHLGLSLESFQTQLVEASISVVSLDSSLDDGDGERLPLISQLADHDALSVPDQVDRQQAHRLLVEAVRGLPERDRLVISLYYYEDLTLKEISEILGVSTSRVSQIHAAAVFKLRSMLRANDRLSGAA
jgi:RNA polymerase sigma factor for flagellar operon FliA